VLQVAEELHVVDVTLGVDVTEPDLELVDVPAVGRGPIGLLHVLAWGRGNRASARCYRPRIAHPALRGVLPITVRSPRVVSDAELSAVERSPAGRSVADETGTLAVERPTGDQILHRGGVVAVAQPVLHVQPVRGLDPLLVDLDAQPRSVRQRDPPVLDAQRIAGEALAVLPDPVRVDGGDLAGRRGGDVG